MTITEYTLDKVQRPDETLTISSSGFSFNASFIKLRKLENKTSIKFFKDDENIYWLGFDFFDEIGLPNTLTLINKNPTRNGATRTVKAVAIFNNSPVLKKLKDVKSKDGRTFNIKKDIKTNLFYVNLCPSFEFICKFEDKNSIDVNDRGIYRYKDKENKILYIGKGKIRERANENDRSKWNVSVIEYSKLNSYTEDDLYKWESYHINQYEKDFGDIPLLNKIKGRDSTD